MLQSGLPNEVAALVAHHVVAPDNDGWYPSFPLEEDDVRFEDFHLLHLRGEFVRTLSRDDGRAGRWLLTLRHRGLD